MKDFDKYKYIEQVENMEPEELKSEYLKLVAEFESVCNMYEELHKSNKELRKKNMEAEYKNKKYMLIIENAKMMLEG